MFFYLNNGLLSIFKSILGVDKQCFDRQKNTRSIGGCHTAASPYLAINLVRLCLTNHFLHQVIDNLIRSKVRVHDFQLIKPTLDRTPREKPYQSP